MIKNIYFSSNTQSELFPSNTRSKFSTYNDIDHLNYLPDGEIDIAVKSIAFDNKLDRRIFSQSTQVPDIVILKEYNVENMDPLKYLEFLNPICKTFVAGQRLRFDKNYEYIFRNEDTSIEQLKSFYYQKKADEPFTSIVISLPTKKQDKKQGIMYLIFLNEMKLEEKEEILKILNQTLSNLSFINAAEEDNESINFDLHYITLHENGCLKRYGNENTQMFFSEKIYNLIQFDAGFETKKVESLRSMLSENAFSSERVEFKKYIGCEILNELLDLKIYHHFTEWKSETIVKQINFLKHNVLALRSDVIDHSFSSAVFDQLLAVFSVENLLNDVVDIEFRNPIFYRTSKEKISRASFQFIDLETGESPYFGLGVPTFIHCVVKPSPTKMQKPFSILLDSSCPISKKFYPKNSNTEFTINLPETLQLQGNWELTLKSLFIPSKMYNILGDKFFFIFKSRKHNTKIVIEEGHYTMEGLLDIMQFHFNKEEIPIKIYLNKKKNDGKVEMKFNLKGKTHTKKTNELFFSPHLANVLGFTHDLFVSNWIREYYDYEYEYGHLLTFHYVIDKIKQAPYAPNINLLLPRYLIILTSIVKNTIFGGQHVKLLQLVVNNANDQSDILSHDFLHNEYVSVDLQEIKSIDIKIVDVTGETIKCEPVLPTRMQLQFVNI
jgi:hypothetical protein